MTISQTLTDAIGATPLIRLNQASDETGCTILGKAEFMNPGGSVKDRAARFIILDAEARSELRPGGVIVAGARQLGPGHTIVTILRDSGTRYQSKLYNPAFARDKGLPVPAWL